MKDKKIAMQINNKNYSFWLGLWKYVQNLFCIAILPAILYAINGYTEWLPIEYQPYAALILGAVGYMSKNKYQFEKRK